MENYDDFYERISRPFHPYVKKLRFINHTITKVMYAVYPLLLAFVFWKNGRAVLPYIVIPGMGFIVLSWVRKVINQPRPYETWTIEPLIEKDSSGQSMPSRHVFSASIISMGVLSVNLWLGILLLILSALLACCRVIGGVHYPKDVIVGYIVGIALGSLLFWLI
ncbi:MULTISPECIES: phosphatase PAP2 family protein [Streptococcus]|uniref:Phosphatase PAP2 family protein n=1 Tax=Streptococcus caledonicus TaxID=2614158 RepID=A0ABW0UAB5_9STRE|nr:phosphatase PAP2 family protein [Streptococcus sp. S784/96/1]